LLYTLFQFFIMENICLSIFLFLIYFSVISWFQTSGYEGDETNQPNIPIEQQIRDMFVAIDQSELDIDNLIESFRNNND
jgi:hypothetical protein